MKPDDIPQEAWDEARDIAFDFDCDWSNDGRRRGEVEEHYAITLIARAILAAEQRERERCARIAEETEDGIAVWPDGHDIATAIRNFTALSHEEPTP